MSTTPGPLARVTLPGGQTLDCVVLGRSREMDGTWWYDLEIVLISKTEKRAGAQDETYSSSSSRRGISS